MSGVISTDLLQKMDAYWRAANYLSVGQIYLRDNPLLRRPLEPSDIKSMLLGHWGTTPGQNFIYVHLNRVIKQNDLDMIYISGPGHGGPALMSNVYLEGSWSEIYPDMPEDEEGMKTLFRKFSWPGGLSSHVSPQVPGSMHEGGELGYSVSHAFGAVFDNPELIAACVVGDGEAETGPIATAWHSNKFLNPRTDGAVLPILHLNGYKISNPTILARIEHEELEQLFRGYGWNPIFVEGSDPTEMHRKMAEALDYAVDEIKRIQHQARVEGNTVRPRWPMIILRSPKGWTGPKEVNGQPNEDSFRSHQVPLAIGENQLENLKSLEEWLLSYRPHELFDENGRLKAELRELAPEGGRRMGSNVHTNGGKMVRKLQLPNYRDYEVKVDYPSIVNTGNTEALAPWLRDVVKLNSGQRNFRIFAPDETMSNRLGSVFEVTDRQWNARIYENDDFLAPDGLVLDSQLSEHQAQGWLEGYLLTGRHGLLHSYEAFIRVVDSMMSQHAKWMKMSDELDWREPLPSLNYLLTSHVWRQDHNGFTHQDPGFIDHILNKKPDVARVYLPPDANTTLRAMDHCLKSMNHINLVITGKHPAPQWLTMDQAVEHFANGISIWDWASNTDGGEPDVVMAAAGDIPTLEIMAATSILRQRLPNLKVRVVNVIDLMRMQPESIHPHGLSDEDYDEIFTTNRPIIFAFHGYPWVIHRIMYRRKNQRMHVRGYKEEGTITTAFDMTVKNDMDRFHLVMSVIERANLDSPEAQQLYSDMKSKLVEHQNYIEANGQDLPEIRNWQWTHTQSN